jgi:hypothetical protein
MMIKMKAKLMMIKIIWILLQMHQEYILKLLIYLLLIFRICLLIPAFIVAYMMLKMLFNAKAKIVINGFAMEKVMQLVIKIKEAKIKSTLSMDLILFGIWSKVIIKKYKFMKNLL